MTSRRFLEQRWSIQLDVRDKSTALYGSLSQIFGTTVFSLNKKSIFRMWEKMMIEINKTKKVFSHTTTRIKNSLAAQYQVNDNLDLLTLSCSRILTSHLIFYQKSVNIIVIHWNSIFCEHLTQKHTLLPSILLLKNCANEELMPKKINFLHDETTAAIVTFRHTSLIKHMNITF